MPRDLPGFYFDPAKNRYFPISSKPKPSQNAESDHPESGPQTKDRSRDHTRPSSSAAPKTKHAGTLFYSLQGARTTHTRRVRDRCFHDLQSYQWRATSRCDTAAFLPYNHAKVSDSRVMVFEGRIRHILGDSQGWIYSRMPTTGLPPTDTEDAFVSEANLASQISSICASGSRYIATSFGPACKILYGDWAADRTMIIQPSTHLVHDVWASDFRDRTLVLGMRKRGLLFPDMEQVQLNRKLSTGSDVLSVHQHQSLVYTGSRNGAIHRFDTREPGLPGLTLLGDAFHETSNSVIFLNIVNEWELVVSTVRGNVELFDIRFPRGTRPLMTLHGQKNTHILDLPHAISPCRKYLFAAGLDSRIRGWSLISGQPLLSPDTTHMPKFSTLSSSNNGVVRVNPFKVDFGEILTSLEVIEIEHQTCLFATTGDRLFRFLLGQQFIGS